jgi:hypothetical protein
MSHFFLQLVEWLKSVSDGSMVLIPKVVILWNSIGELMMLGL